MNPGVLRQGIDIDPQNLLQIRFMVRALQFPPLHRVSSNMGGRYTSNIRGRGIDFDEVRRYQPGDDIRNMDWRVTARTDKPHTRIYKEEKERPVIMAVDLGKTMQFGTKRAFKSVTAAETAALLGWAASNNQERVGGVIFSESNHIESRPASGSRGVLRLINTMTRFNAEQKKTESKKTDNDYFYKAILRLKSIARPGSMIIIISDFQQTTEKCWTLIDNLSQHCDLIFINIFDKLETTPPVSGRYGITDGKNRTILDTTDRKTVLSYETLYRLHKNRIDEYCKKRGITNIQASTEFGCKDILNQLVSSNRRYRQRKRA